jgi:integrase
MSRIKLTPRVVRDAQCAPAKRKTDYFDTSLPGFLLEVRCSGGKTFYLRYRDPRGRERQYKLGAASILTLAEARQKAKRALAQVLLGNDPRERILALREIPTLARFVAERYLPFAKSTKRSWRTDETILRLHILPVLGKLALDEVSASLVAELLQRLRCAGYSSGTTNRVIVLLRFIFNNAKKWGMPGVDRNPSSAIPTEPDVCRERYLSKAEMDRLLGALAEDENQLAAKAIRLLLLTGARRNEVTQARWEHIDWDRKTLLVPVSKTGRPRMITLSKSSLELLHSIQPVDGNPFIFPSPITGRPCPSLHFPWTRIRQRADLEGVRLHDLRHSFASVLVNNGVSLYVVQGLLGHTQPRMTQRYAHLSQGTLRAAADVAGAAIERPVGSGATVFHAQASAEPPTLQTVQ